MAVDDAPSHGAARTAAGRAQPRPLVPPQARTARVGAATARQARGLSTTTPLKAAAPEGPAPRDPDLSDGVPRPLAAGVAGPVATASALVILGLMVALPVSVWLASE